MPKPQISVGRLGISETLRGFVEELPDERRSILAFVLQLAESLPPGADVLDLGAGAAPYRELFAHCQYLTADLAGSGHERAAEVDLKAPADALPLEGASVDAVLLTQVLEHVPSPGSVLSEVNRVLRPGGRVGLTVPFVWELHEMPSDFWRFTPPSLEMLLSQAGFVDITIDARTDCFTTVAQLMRNLALATGRAADGRDAERDAASALLGELADRVAGLAPLDLNRILPLGWAARARRP